jgi:hypothetical protein
MTETQVPAVPRAALLALHDHGADIAPKLIPTQGPPKALATYRTGHLVLMVPANVVGRQMNLLETAGRYWATQHSIATPELLAVDPSGDWLLGKWVEAVDPTGPTYVTKALRIADQIMESPTWQPPLAPSTWSASSKGRVGRVRRMITAGINLRRWLAARETAQNLPDRAMSHNDYYFRNVLRTPSDSVVVVDWEFAGLAPRFTDHLRMWSTLKNPEDREIALEIILAGRSKQELEHIGVLGRWLTYRLFAENLAVPRRLQNPPDLEHARRGVQRGDELFNRTTDGSYSRSP